MIDAEIFAVGWQAILNRFNRDVDEEETARYYGFLTKRLDSDQFMAAAEKLWQDADRFPKPGDFLEHAPPPSRPTLPSHVPDDDKRDPWWQPVSRIVRGSKAAKAYGGMFAERRRGGVVVNDDTGPPFYFPRHVIEEVESEEFAGLTYVDRPELRRLARRGDPQ